MEIRRVRKNEMEQAIKLADHTFRKEGHISMGDAFPQVFSKELGLSYGAFDGEKLVSFMGLVPSKLRVDEAELSVFSIGAVCTDEAYRNQGISSSILREVYEYIDHAGASLLFVSGDRGLYKRNHCYHFGKTYHYKLKKEDRMENEYQASVRLGDSSDIFQIDQLRRKTKVRYESNIWEWTMLLKTGGYTSIFKMDQSLYVADNNGDIEAYAVIGLPNERSTKDEAIMTEWGGNPKAVHRILAKLLEDNAANEIGVAVPWHEEIQKEFSNYSLEMKQNGGTVYVVDTKRLIKQTMPYLDSKNAKLAQSLKVWSIDEEILTIQYDQSTITLNREELVNLLFGFQDEIEIGDLRTVFPIPLPNMEGMYYV